IAHSEKKYILGDYTKFQRSSLFKICDWSEITALITNDIADKDGIAEVAKHTTVVTC
ncbi:TPA: DeoR/GlpR family DNA-binding transcription regulator, partial [Klebsiella pneumoniae]